MASADFLLPDLDDDSTAFWEGCAAGELRVQVCNDCGTRQFPPRPMCHVCRSFDRRFDATSGRGRVWSFVVTHPPVLPAYTELAPYNVVVVELDEDPTIRFVGNLVDGPDAAINSVDPSSIEIGQLVTVVFQQIADDVWLPRWVPERVPDPDPAAG
jgi:hypothetical protein